VKVPPTILKYIWIFAAIILFVLTPLIAHSAVYKVIPASEPKNLVEGQIWAAYPLLKHIASCESWGDPNKEPREFNALGTVLRGYPNPNDIGLAQINLPTWGAKAKELGFDLYTYQGNLGMAKWIYDHYGSAPWKYSKGCWGQYQT
jgi:hypothetical protein